MDAKRKELERKLSNVLVRLHKRLRKLYGPPGDDWNLEIMMFSGAMVLTALTDLGRAVDDAERGVQFASICTLSIDVVRPAFGLEARITDEQIDAVMPKKPGTPVLDG